MYVAIFFGLWHTGKYFVTFHLNSGQWKGQGIGIAEEDRDEDSANV